MTVEELIADIVARDGEEVEHVAAVEDPELMFNLAITLLQEVGILLDALTDKSDRKISRKEMREISKAADEIYEFLKGTDMDEDFEILRERE